MGRRIPKKKHRGVKDPVKQRAKRLAELSLRINAPPKNIDEQAIPKSLEHVIKLKEAAKSNGILKKKPKKKKNTLICVGLQPPRVNSHPKARPEKVTPVFQQKSGESGQQFWHRVSKETDAFLKETKFEDKYGVQVERNPETGLIQGLTKRKVDKNIERLYTENSSKKKKKGTIVEKSTTLSKSQKRKLKLSLKKERKKADNDDNDFDKLQDKVAFGEVAHEPPRLKIKAKEHGQERKPRNLLLNSLLMSPKKIAASSKIIDRSGKRKNLPVAERRQLEMQQSKVIAAYKRLKSQRSADKSC